MNTENLIRRGRGRPKGSRNATSRAAKDVIQGVADKLGGLDRMAAWAKEDPLNERAFWASIYPKMLPLAVEGDMKLAVTAISRTVKFPDAAVAGEPITQFAPTSAGAESYRQLAREVLAR